MRRIVEHHRPFVPPETLDQSLLPSGEALCNAWLQEIGERNMGQAILLSNDTRARIDAIDPKSRMRLTDEAFALADMLLELGLSRTPTVASLPKRAGGTPDFQPGDVVVDTIGGSGRYLSLQEIEGMRLLIERLPRQNPIAEISNNTGTKIVKAVN